MKIATRDMNRLRNLVDSIDLYDAKCESAEYTDTDEAWDILRMVRCILAEIVPPGLDEEESE